jgi:sulfide:quinone oxidoreductase
LNLKKQRGTRDGRRVTGHTRLIVCPGLKLDWNKVEGLVGALISQNGASRPLPLRSAPYTWQSVAEQMKRGARSSPNRPCRRSNAQERRKRRDLSGDAWRPGGGVLKISTSISTKRRRWRLFGVKDYLPALMEYVNNTHANLNFFHNLVVDALPPRRLGSTSPNRIRLLKAMRWIL